MDETVPVDSIVDRQLSDQIADAMFALSTPSRVRILIALMAGPKTVGEITELLEMEQSAVSHQLRILREHRLVRAERDGRRRIYDLHSEHLGSLIQAAVDHVRRLEGEGKPFGRARRSAPGA